MEEQPVIDSERPSRAVADAESTFSVSSPITPIPPEERDLLLDALRGAALFGVLTVNLLDGFRVSLFESILTFHTHSGRANHAVDILTAWVFEFKAFALFPLLFGIGIGIQIDRARSHNLSQSRLFVRRFLVLLAVGLGHMLLIWNGDILALYALCGLVLIPLAGISARRLATIGIAVIVVSPHLPFFGAWFPTQSAMRLMLPRPHAFTGDGSRCNYPVQLRADHFTEEAKLDTGLRSRVIVACRRIPRPIEPEMELDTIRIRAYYIRNRSIMTNPEDLLPLPPAIFHILVALSEGERHGYAIKKDVARRSGGKVQLGPGTLYGSIKKMLEDELIEESADRPDLHLDDERRRYYRLTPFGRRVAAAEVERMRSLVKQARGLFAVPETGGG